MRYYLYDGRIICIIIIMIVRGLIKPKNINININEVLKL